MALIQGYRVRKFFTYPTSKKLVKEIQLMIRKENRELVKTLKENQRKKIKGSIIQLITSCHAYSNQSDK